MGRMNDQYIVDHTPPDDDDDDGTCPDCLPKSLCGACEDDRRFHEDRDNRIERDA